MCYSRGGGYEKAMLRHWVLLLIGMVVIAIAGAPLRAEADHASGRIVAVGDLHGDFEAWKRIATGARIVDTNGDWTGGETRLVQLGDVTDRGPDSLKIIRHLQQLQAQAKAAGGGVIVLLGNHEAMNVLGDLRYVHPGEYEAFVDEKSMDRLEGTWRANKRRIVDYYRTQNEDLPTREIKRLWFGANPPGKLEHRRAWSPGGELAQWAASLPAVVKLGTSLFVHGGLSGERALRPLSDVNSEISAALGDGDAIDRTGLEDPLGPLWYRGNVIRGESDAKRDGLDDEVARVLAYHQAERIIVGHTPSVSGIEAVSNARVVRADTGISAHYGGVASFLEIVGSRVIANELRGNGEWISRQISE
ncbi:metallophosphoesterase [Altererythrobacter sp. MF3-039]|uniref:metallophosphoesterase n=1 Tax=Altererythrobacter sp. MF3-039 TaxID=3252901 RepID=UPI00390CCC56